MSILYTNNYATTLNGAINNSTTSIVVTSVTGLPAVGSGDYCYLTIDDGTNIEIVRVDSNSGTTLTVVRGQQGTTASSFADGDPIELRATREGFGISGVQLQHNYSASAAPGTGDDSADGYAVGSVWIDTTNDDAYICLDATASSAVWTETTGAGGGGSVSISGTPVDNQFAIWTAADTIEGVAALTYDGTTFTSTATIDFGGATSLEIPNGTTMTTNAAGEIALDTNGDGSTITTGVIQVYDGTQNTFVVSTTNFPSSDNDVPAYDSATNSVTWQAQAGGGGGAPTNAQYVTLATDGTLSDERVLTAGEGIDLADGGAGSTITISGELATDTNKGIAAFGSGDFLVSAGDVTLVPERIKDIAGSMFTGNTETGITVTYQGADDTVDFVVSDTTVAGDSGSTGITPGDTLTIAGSDGINTAMSGDTLTISKDESTVRASLTSNQSITDATYTKVQIDSEVYDTNSDFDSTTNYRFTPTVAGKFLVIMTATFLSLAAGSIAQVVIRKNGSNATLTEVKNFSTSASNISATVSDFVDCNGSTDYIEMFVYHNHGSAINVQGGGTTTLAAARVAS